jgi:hypothetical protein
MDEAAIQAIVVGGKTAKGQSVRGGKFLLILDGISDPPMIPSPRYLSILSLVIWHRSSSRFASLAYTYSLKRTLVMTTQIHLCDRYLALYSRLSKPGPGWPYLSMAISKRSSISS